MPQGGVPGIRASPIALAGEASKGSWGEVGPAFQRNTGLILHPAVHSSPTPLGSASCCIVRHQKPSGPRSFCCPIWGGQA